MDGGARGVLGGDIESVLRPGPAEGHERRHEQVVDDRLERALREHLVEDRTRGRDVHVGGRGQEALDEVGLAAVHPCRHPRSRPGAARPEPP